MVRHSAGPFISILSVCAAPIQGTSYAHVLTSDGLEKEDPSSSVAPLHSALVKQAIGNKMRRRRFTNSYNMLFSLKSASFPLHAATVRQMQFSPDGKHLATCRLVFTRCAFIIIVMLLYSLDRTCLFLDVQVVFFCRYPKLDAYRQSCRISPRKVVSSVSARVMQDRSLGASEVDTTIKRTRLTCVLRSPHGEFVLTRLQRNIMLWEAPVS